MSTIPPFASVSEFISVLQARQWTFSAAVEPAIPVVSIISSFFNAHQYFEETYQSVINQTFQNFEWLIVEDCSTDPDAIALFQSLPARSTKIKPLHHDVNKGLSAGRNTAIANAQGKYLFFIDLDDLIDPIYIEKCVLFLETHPDFSLVNSYSVGFQDQDYWWHHGFAQPRRFIQQNWVTGRLLYRKADFDKLGGFDPNLSTYADWERWLKAIVHGQKGWTIPEYLDCYRRTDTGMLATTIKNPTENQREINTIQSRYQPFFDNNHLSDIHLERNHFNSQPFRSKIAVKNPLKHHGDNPRILCLFPQLEFGGSTRFNLDLLTLLSKRGYDLTIATTLASHNDWHQYFYRITPDIFHLFNILDPYQWLSFTRYILESRQIDLVLLSNSYIAYYFLPILRHEFPDVSFVDFTHTGDPGWRGIGYPRVACQFRHLLDRQVVTSNALATIYQEINPAALAKLKVCYTNIDTNEWMHDADKRQQLRAKLNIAEPSIVLLFPARLVEQKRPLFLVDIVKALTQFGLSICVIVVGDGHLRSEMEAKVNRLGLNSNFRILHRAEPTDMVDYYSASDILLLPSAYEGISLSLFEAMAMQLPVVASDVVGQAELVTPETGFLIAKGEADDIEVQAYLQVLLPLIQNQSLRQQVGDRARQRVMESFSLTDMADQMETIFAEAIALCQTQPKPTVDLAISEEMLLMAIEYTQQEQTIGTLWCDRNELARQNQAMKTSKLWQLRRQWFRLKRWLRLTQEEEL